MMLGPSVGSVSAAAVAKTATMGALLMPTLDLAARRLWGPFGKFFLNATMLSGCTFGLAPGEHLIERAHGDTRFLFRITPAGKVNGLGFGSLMDQRLLSFDGQPGPPGDDALIFNDLTTGAWIAETVQTCWSTRGQLPSIHVC